MQLSNIVTQSQDTFPASRYESGRGIKKDFQFQVDGEWLGRIDEFRSVSSRDRDTSNTATATGHHHGFHVSFKSVTIQLVSALGQQFPERNGDAGLYFSQWNPDTVGEALPELRVRSELDWDQHYRANIHNICNGHDIHEHQSVGLNSVGLWI